MPRGNGGVATPGGGHGGRWPRLSVADCITIGLGLGFVIDLFVSLDRGHTVSIGGLIAGMAGTGLVGHRMGSVRAERGAAQQAGAEEPAVSQPTRCTTVDREEQPDPDLVRLVSAVVPGEAPWCAVPKAGDQAGIALALLASWQLEWLALVAQEGLELYQREWVL
jgi:hypothetical protein